MAPMELEPGFKASNLKKKKKEKKKGLVILDPAGQAQVRLSVSDITKNAR